MGTRPRRILQVIAVTGGPGGGKTELLRAIASDAALAPVASLSEEAIHGMRFVRMSPRAAEFQCALVAIQAATEDSVMRALAGSGKQVLLSHRGTLDPCAFWQSFGNSRESFFEMTVTTLEDHYRRYDMVIHMESAAVRVPEAYLRHPAAHRPEDVAQAALLDRYLAELWGGHPRYVKIEGMPDFEEKMARGMGVIRGFVGAMRWES